MKKRMLSMLVATAILFTMLPMASVAKERAEGLLLDSSMQSESGGADVADSGVSVKGDVCVCTALCVQGGVNSPCPVCVAVGANLVDICKGEAPGLVLAASAEISDDLWVGGVKVTRANAENITGNGITGTVTYDSDTATLTLSDAKITNTFTDETINKYGIYVESISQKRLNIVLLGTNIVDISQQNTENNSIGIKADCSVLISGDGSLIATAGSGEKSSVGIQAAVLIVDGGKVYASGGKSANQSVGILALSVSIQSGVINVLGGKVSSSNAQSYGISGAHSINMSGGMVTMVGETAALSSISYPDFLDGYKPVIMAGNALDGSDAKQVASNTPAIYVSRYIHVGSIQQDIWIGGRLVNEANAEDILGDGTAHYDLSTNTLFLNNANIGEVYQINENLYGIYTDRSLKLVLSGNNTINPPPSNRGSSCGIYINETLSIAGSGLLSANGNQAVESSGIQAGTLEVLSGKLKVSGYRGGVSSGISAYTVHIKGGEIEAGGGVSKQSYGIAANNITISGGKVAAFSNRFASEWDESYAITADSLVIEGDGTRVNTWSGIRTRKDLTIHSGILDTYGSDYGIRVDEGNVIIGNENGVGVLWVKVKGESAALNRAPLLKPNADYYTTTGIWSDRQASWILPQGAPDDDSGSSGSSGDSSEPVTPKENNTIDSAVGNKGAANVVAKAIQEAVAANTDITNAHADFRNFDYLALDGLEAINKIAAKEAAGKAVNFKVSFDAVNQGVVESRIAVDPFALAKEMTARKMMDKLSLGIWFDQQKDCRVQMVKDLFSRYFTNQIVVVVYDQRSPLAVNAEVCVKLNIAQTFGQDQQLYFYTYDNVKNCYSHIAAPNYWVDKNGYAHITAPLGGSIIITDKPLTR